MKSYFTDRESPLTVFVADLDTARDWYGSCLTILGWASAQNGRDQTGEFVGFEEEEATGISLVLRPISLTGQAVESARKPRRIFIRAPSTFAVSEFYKCAAYKRRSLWEPRFDPDDRAYSAAVIDHDNNELVARCLINEPIDVKTESPTPYESTMTPCLANRRRTTSLNEPVYINNGQAPLERRPGSVAQRSFPRSASHSDYRPRSLSQRLPVSKPLGPLFSALSSVVSGAIVGFLNARDEWKDRRQDERRRERKTESTKNSQNHSSTKHGKRSQDRRESAFMLNGSIPGRREASPSQRPFVSEFFVEPTERRFRTFGRQSWEVPDRHLNQPSRRFSMPTQSTPNDNSHVQPYRNEPPPVPDAPPILSTSLSSPMTRQQRSETVSGYPPSSYNARLRDTPPSRRASESDRYTRRPEYERVSRRNLPPLRETVRRPISEAQEPTWFPDTLDRRGSRPA